MNKIQTTRDVFKEFTESDKTFVQSFKKTAKINDNASALFATNAMEKIDMKLNKPRYKYFWSQEMPVIYGGGAIEQVSYLRQTFSKPDPMKILASGTTNQVHMVNERVSKQSTPVIPIILGAELGLIDQMKYEQIGYDRFGAKLEAVGRDYNEALDELAFHGHVFQDQTYYGLYNNPDIKRTDSTTNWEDATIDDLVKDFMGQLIGIVKDLEYDVDGISPNHISIPIDFFADLALPAVIGSPTGTTVVTSKLEYLRNQLNIFLSSYGSAVNFYPSRFLAKGEADDGENGEGRAVIMCRDQAIFRMPITMPLTRGATVNLGVQGITTSFVAFVGVPQFIWLSGIRYLDNVAKA